jgi:hypothetical protein
VLVMAVVTAPAPRPDDTPPAEDQEAEAAEKAAEPEAAATAEGAAERKEEAPRWVAITARSLLPDSPAWSPSPFAPQPPPIWVPAPPGGDAPR